MTKPQRGVVARLEERESQNSRVALSRRSLGRRVALASAAAWVTSLWHTPGAFAEALVETPHQTEGPFFPDRLPRDTDNDLLRINDAIRPSVGVITHMDGTVRSAAGTPLRNATVEIWQTDNNGAYLHTRSDNAAKRDPHFQGYGRFLTGMDGRYSFRTIRPTPYPGRVPHIHVAVTYKNRRVLTTQCYIAGYKGNARDGILQSIRDPKARASVIVPFSPVKGSRLGELHARFDMVVGVTPTEGPTKK